MQKLEFLKEVLPTGVRHSLRMVKKILRPDGKKDEVVHNKFYNTLGDQTTQDIEEYMETGWNVYYSTAGFGSKNKADADNAVCKKELYVDIDCGEKKPYADKTAGIIALQLFTKAVGLPKPTLVDSGNGIHAHWFLQEAVPVHEWKAVAEALKDKCVKHSFIVDAQCTSDVVRVLRVPGTTNFRGDHLTALLTPIKFHDFAALRDVIGASDNAAEAAMLSKARALTVSSGKDLSEVSKLIASNKSSRFQIIWDKSMAGTGCAQIKHAIENADTLSEPLWRAAISNANFCEDRDWAIHELSKNYPNYTAEETERKAAETKGPYTCNTYEKLDTGSLCSGCKFKGKITAPIQIGNEVKEAPKEELVAVVNETKYDISYPAPYFRGKHGGVYMYVTNKETGESGSECVYPHDLYIYQRMRDIMLGDMLCFRHHLPRGDIREFAIPQSDFSSRDKFRDSMNREGVMVFTPTQLFNLQSYVGSQIQELQFREKADTMRTRFGWTTEETFIVGNREYTKTILPSALDPKKMETVIRHSPIAKGLEDYVRWFTPTGSLDEWKSIAAQYEKEEFDNHALGLLAGFGSILMHLSPEDGGMINYYSKKSGTGKSTVLRMVNSIFGHPTSLMKNAADTKLSKVHRMGVMNGMPVTMDEMTNISPEELSDFVYQSTQGRARDRMQGNTNAERPNNITWKCIVLCSSNSSFKDKLAVIKADPQGEMARMLEIHLQTPVPSDVLESQKLFNALSTNYGHAGHVYLSYVVPHLRGAVMDSFNFVRDRIYSKHKWKQTERFALNNVICIITAGLITNHLGLTNYDINRLTKKAVMLVRDSTTEMEALATRSTETFAAFLNKNINSLMIVDHSGRVGGLVEPVKREPRNSLMARYEIDTKTLYIAQRDFNKWCAEQFINSREMRSMFKSETGVELLVVKKRLAKGWNADFGPVSAYEIRDATNVLGIELDSMVELDDDGMAPAKIS